MSVFVKITAPGGAVYRVSDGPTEHSGFAWRPILTNTVPIERAARATENGIPTSTQTLNVWNAERYIGVVDESLNDALTDSAVEIEVTGIDGSWNGIIKAWEQGSNGLLSIRAGQDTLAVFKRQVPDETVRLVTFTGASRDAVNTTIPTVIGGTTSDPIPVPGILIDRAGFTWAFCVGKCRSFVRVKSDRKTITTGFTTYLGTADQAIWPGMVCVKFDADPRDSNGAWPEISAELVGLEIGSTEAEGRNAARVIRAYLTTADTGACGWGLGEPADSIDTVSFDQAILVCDTLELHLDGMMSQAALSSYWLSQMCLGGRLRLDKPAGKWRLRVDMATDSVKEYDENNILLYSFWPGDSSMRHKRARVNYRADFITKQFLGSATRTIGTIGEEENLLEQHLVRDHTTGNALADYVANIEKYGELRMQIQTPDVAVGTRTLEEDEVVTIRVPEFPNGRLFRVTSLSQGTDESKIELRSYADAIFDTATPETTTDPALDPIVRATPLPMPPLSPNSIILSTGARVQPDGLTIVYVDGTFTSAVGTLFVKIEVGEGANPEAWFEYGTVSDGGSFHHEPCKPGQVYTYRLTAANTGGESAPVTASITSAGDTSAPGVPTVTVTGKFISSKVVISLANAPDDLAGFRVYRGETTDPQEATYLASVSSRDGYATFSDHILDFTKTYYYFARAFDLWKNVGEYSSASNAVKPYKILSDDIMRRLTPADSLNTDPYFEDFSAWGSDLAGTAANEARFVYIADGVAGTREFKSASGAKMIFGVSLDSLIPFDSTRYYVLSAFFRGNNIGTHGLGFAFYDDEKTLLGTSTAEEYAITVSDAWEEQQKTFTTAPDGARWFGPMVVVNNDTDAGAILEIQKLRIREVLTSDILIANEAVITRAAQIAVGVITDAHILNLDAGKITTGIISSDLLDADVASIKQLTVLGKNLVEDPSFMEFPTTLVPTGSESEITVGRWTVAGDGNLNTTSLKVLTSEAYPTKIAVGRGLKIVPFTVAQNKRVWIAQGVKVLPGESYCFSAHITLDETVPTDTIAPHTIIIEWRTDTAYISQVAGLNTDDGRVYVSGTAPSNATQAILYILFPPHDAGVNTIVSAVQFEKSVDGATFWVGREQGTIQADRIYTGLLRSGNYGASTGSMFDLNCGTFKLGGSSAPKLSWDGSNLSVSGSVTITGGSGISNLSDAGFLATANDLDGVPDGTNYAKTTPNQACGASLAYGSLNASGALITRVVPASAAAPSGAGLYLGCDYLGYYNGSAWKTYMDKTGKFYLSGSGGGLGWDGDNLTVCGTICATSGSFNGYIYASGGTIGDFCITCYGLGAAGGICPGGMGGWWLDQSIYLTSGGLNSYWTWCYNCVFCLCTYMHFNHGTITAGGCHCYSQGCCLETSWLVLEATDGDCWKYPSIRVCPCQGSSCYGIMTSGIAVAASYQCISDRNKKERISSVEVLPSIRSLPISEWSFKGSKHRRIGPMAQDFFALFPFHADSPELVGNLDGIALKGVQEIDGCIGCLQACVAFLESRLAKLEKEKR